MANPAPDEAARVTSQDLLEDLRAVVYDVEALLRATEGQAGEKIADIRARAAETLNHARQRIHDVGSDVEMRARAAARNTDAYVRANPWTAIAIAAGAGYLLGLLGRRR